MAASDKETSERRHYAPEEGVVVNNADPMRLGRVTVRVPGLYDVESGWLRPFGMPGAGGGPTTSPRGSYDVPPLGADVVVIFISGDPDKPRWTWGHYGSVNGAADTPDGVAALDPADADKLKVYETDRYLVTFDDRAAAPSLTFVDKLAGDMVQMDGRAMAISVQATTQVTIRSGGLLVLDGLDIQIGGRKLLKNGDPIQ